MTTARSAGAAGRAARVRGGRAARMRGGRARARPQQLDLLGLPAADRMPTPLSRATARLHRSHETPAPRPWQCTVLAVDTARVSGWAVYQAGELVAFGEVDTLDECCVVDVVGHAAQLHSPCILVLEAPWGGSVEVVAALGAARERWSRAWRSCGQSRGRVVRVQPSTWRAAVIGSRSVGMTREQVRATELRLAQCLVGQPDAVLGHDAAAAILIGRWATHARAVGRVLGARAMRASLAAWVGRS